MTGLLLRVTRRSGPVSLAALLLLLSGSPGVLPFAPPSASLAWAPSGDAAAAPAQTLVGVSGHEASQGLGLMAAPGETVTPGGSCPADAPVRAYSIVAIAIDITLNRFLDHDPDGRMFVREEDLPRVRDEEARTAAVRGGSPFQAAVSIGLQGDAIQPLTIRALPGECLRLTLRDDLPDGEPVSLHLHGSSLRVEATGRPAIATEPSAVAVAGGTVAYEWAIPPGLPEGTHYFHSEALTRQQTDHGLFGALIVERPGTEWLDPLSGLPIESGWQAMIVDPSGPAYREFALYYHEVGNEDTKIRDAHDGLVPVVDPLTNAYRPGTRALDYRSEPFSNRLALQAALDGTPDESLAYSSYAFGDPATPMMRSYVGDPVKERVIHAGSEVAHVAHVHGGAIRWRRDALVEPSDFATGLQKHPPLVPAISERTDSQVLGPSETFDIAHECGAGGCQASVGDFLWHCHIAEHYFAGMWGLWRVYDTLQDGPASTDGLPPLLPLPDRSDQTLPAVPSDVLLGTSVDPGTGPLRVSAPVLRSLVEGQLPPQGIPGSDDAAVFDWSLDGQRYLGEPETKEVWPGYQSDIPGSRPALLFDPRTGRLAYPFLRPHLGRRPPFAPQHGPAPFLDPPGAAHGPPVPGANGPASICPTGTSIRPVDIVAMSLPVTVNAAQDLVDPAGELYVLRDQVAALAVHPEQGLPLVIRANAGEDCLDATLTSRLADHSGVNLHGKVGLHIHFVQFDVQASDGLDAGFNYEQTVRPYTEAGRPLASSADAGASEIVLGAASLASGALQAGALVGVGLDTPEGFETRQIVSVDGDRLRLDAPLERDHAAGEIVSTEFVHYRWYPDAQVGTSYFHDHVNGISSWHHGLFGALVVEPPGSTYLDPHDGHPIESGVTADIHTRSPVSFDVSGSFREFVLCVIDGTDIDRVGRSTGGAVDLRAEPLDGRTGDPARILDSTVHGDPATPLLEAYVGDPIVIRTLASATNDIHTLHIDGHGFRLEPWSRASPFVDTALVGVSERFDLVIPAAGGPARRAGDYLYRNGRPSKFREGSWGILRVLDRARAPTALMPLPDVPVTTAASGDVCPLDAPLRTFDVHAVSVPLPMLKGAAGLTYVLARDVAAVTSGQAEPRPLVLHIAVGDCLEVRLSNDTDAGDVSFHADGLLVADPLSDAGIDVGVNPPQTTAPGATRTYRLYADPTFGQSTVLITDAGDPLEHPALGLYGAVIVGPPGATVVDARTHADASAASSAAVIVRDGASTYRDFTLFFQDSDQSIGTHRMPYTVKVAGVTAIDYHVATGDPAPGVADPDTPLLEAVAGDRLRIHVLAPVSEQAQVFSIEGHAWQIEPDVPGSRWTDSQSIGGLGALTIDTVAGGDELVPGDYIYGDHRMPYREAGLWGILRVTERPAP